MKEQYSMEWINKWINSILWNEEINELPVFYGINKYINYQYSMEWMNKWATSILWNLWKDELPVFNGMNVRMNYH